MGYSTDFSGSFQIKPALTAEQVATLQEFAETRHYDRPYPNYYCQWVPSDDGTHLAWDGREKFYDYVAWLDLLIRTYFTPWNRVLTGEVLWYGEERSDQGKITVVGNVIYVSSGSAMQYGNPVKYSR